VITAVNGTPVHSTADLSQVLASLNPGQAVPVGVTDPQGTSSTVTVTLGQLPGS
jgi:S1-C subfamily serine protease